MVLLVSGLLCISIMLLVLTLGGFFDQEKGAIERRLMRYAGEGKKVSLYDAQMEEPFLQRTIAPLVQSVTRQVMALAPEQWKKQLDDKLYQAGHPFGLTTEQFVFIQMLCITILPLLTLLLFMKAGFAKALMMGLIVVLIGMILPEYFLRAGMRERALQIQESLPDMLDLLTVSVEAGLGFDAAVSKVVEKIQGPLAMEFKRLLHDVRMGKPRLEAFRDLSRRSTCEDLNIFCSAIVQADQLGVSIGKILRIQSEQMRTKRRQRAEEAAMKAPIKIIFPMVLLILPALFIILMGPAVIRLMNFFGGN